MTDCSRCGNCCEDIQLGFDPAEEDLTKWDARGVADLLFMREHWHPTQTGDADTHAFSCDQFDPATRLCTAHDERPPICRDYPWYGKPREQWATSAPAAGLSPQCSFNADVRIMLPIVEVR